MKMSGKGVSCWAFLLFALTSVSAVQRLNSISDLKNINFGSSVPKHSLVLLHWFANEVEIHNTDVIRLTFDPDSGDYGSHHYGNFEEMLDPLPRGGRYRYFTVGNLYQETSVPLPSYVLNAPRDYEGRNRDRIIIRVWEQHSEWDASRWIDQVYITQHYETFEHQGTIYNPDHTYQVTTNLLRQIRQFSIGENQMQLWYLINQFRSNANESHIRNTWGNLACLGLLLFIVIEEKYSTNQRNSRPEYNTRRENNTAWVYGRRESNNRWENNLGEMNSRMRSSQTTSPDDALSFCFIVLVVLMIIIFFGIFAKG